MNGEVLAFDAICDRHNLYQAWMEVRSGRSLAARAHGAGVDGITVTAWEAEWPTRLQDLRADLLSGRYRPSPLLWFDIPRRPVAEPGDTRRLGIPTVTDRVAQRAVKSVLEPAWEQVFLSCSHGFRRDRSTTTAVAHVLYHEARGRCWVADGDIEACFDSLRHDRLLAQVAASADRPTLNLISSWLEVGAVGPGRGVTQGAVLSPLLANIYLHPFDVALISAGYALVRYADDWVVMCASRQEAEAALRRAGEALTGLGLGLNPAKTAVRAFGPEFHFLGAEFVI